MRRIRSRNRINLVILQLAILCNTWNYFYIPCWAREADDGRERFLYANDEAAENLVLEYQIHLAPSEDFEADVEGHKRPAGGREYDENRHIRPSILSPKYEHNRVVEFYSPWCGHCQRFKDKYIQLAMQVSSKEAIYASKDYVEFHAISCSAHHWVCENNKIKGYPTVRAYKAYSSDYVTLNRFTPESVAESLGLSFDQGRNNENLDFALEIDAQGDITSHVDILGAARDAYKRTKNELFSDAALSFVYSLKNHILPEDSFKTASNGLDKVQKSAFSEWIDLLYWTLPTTWKLHTLIVDIRQNMDHVTSSRSELIAIVEKHHEVILEKTVHWTESCSKGRDNEMSFICGMWNLLHISSIGTASHHKSVLGDKSRVTTQHVATTVRNFIDFFLQGNDFTREHFLELYDKCSFNHCKRFRKKKGVQVQDQSYWEQYPLWLWEVHNSINMELLTLQAIERHSPVTKEEELLVLWPTSGACHDCKNSDGRWNTDGVYQYLMSQYWPSGVHNFRYVVLDKKETESVDENESIFSTKNILLFSVFIIIPARNFRNSRRQCRGRHKKTDSDVV